MTTPLQNISADVRLGKDIIVRDFVNLYGCEIGDETQIGTFVEIQKGVRIGRRCKIQSHSFLCEGVTLEDGVFVGHGVMFTNDKLPQAVNADGSLKSGTDWKCIPTLVKEGAAIGSNATILPGVVIGERALIGAGAVVTRDVPSDTVVAGNPAAIITPRA